MPSLYCWDALLLNMISVAFCADLQLHWPSEGYNFRFKKSNQVEVPLSSRLSELQISVR